MPFRLDKREKRVIRISQKNHPHQCGRVAYLKALQLDSITINGGEKSVNTTWDKKKIIIVTSWWINTSNPALSH